MRPDDLDAVGVDLIGEAVAMGLPRPFAIKLVARLDQTAVGDTREVATAKLARLVKEILDERFGDTERLDRT